MISQEFTTRYESLHSSYMKSNQSAVEIYSRYGVTEEKDEQIVPTHPPEYKHSPATSWSANRLLSYK